MAMAIEPAPPAAVVPLPQEQQPSSVNAVSVGLGIYLLVATLLLIRVLLGLKEVYAWRRESVACSSERLGDAFEMAAQKLDLSNACEIRLHPKLPLPLTVGVRRPTVLFPQAMVDSLSGSKLQAIALHESNHARNHDPLWFFVNNGLRALMWFQPLIWLVHRRFVMAAKECSDMKVVDTAGSPWGYSKLLLALASGIGEDRLVSMPAPGMAMRGRRDLSYRVARILSPVLVTSRGPVVGALLMLVTTFLIAAMIQVPGHAAEEPEGRTSANANANVLKELNALEILLESMVKERQASYIEGAATLGEVTGAESHLMEVKLRRAEVLNDIPLQTDIQIEMIELANRKVRLTLREFTAGATSVSSLDVLAAREELARARLRLAEFELKHGEVENAAAVEERPQEAPPSIAFDASPLTPEPEAFSSLSLFLDPEPEAPRITLDDPPVLPESEEASLNDGPDLTEPCKFLETYLSVSRWQGFLPMSFSVEGLGEKMRAYHQEHPLQLEVIKDVTFQHFQTLPDSDLKFYLYKVSTANNPEGFPFTVEETPDGLRADWESYVEFKDQHLEAFIKDPQVDELPRTFPVILRRAHDVPDSENLWCHKIDAPIDDTAGSFAFISKESALSKQLNHRLNWLSMYFVVAGLKWTENLDDPDKPYLSLEQFKNFNWRTHQ
ncbi:MAG: beta-lactamase regulating signal transducer with metallopeptidase domain [Verrucomicrobiales bacterium]|jgi:beta-lactamase regulating signal transducer with metallopeptidase domain